MNAINAAPQQTRRAANKVTTLKALLQRLILVCILPLLLLAVYLACVRVLDLQARSDEAAARIAGNFMTALDRALAARISGLQVVAASELVDEPPKIVGLNRLALAYRESFGGEVIFTDRAMKILLDTRVALGASPPSSRSTLLSLAGDTVPATLPLTGDSAGLQAVADGRSAISDRYQEPNAAEAVIAAAVPVIRNGVADFVLFNVMEINIFQQRLDALILPSSWVLTVRDGNGVILARRGPLMADDLGAATGRVVVKSAVSRWSVAVEIPRGVYRGSLISAASAVLTLILIATLMSVGGGKLAARRLSRAVATLTEAQPSPITRDGSIIEIENIRQALDDANLYRSLAQAQLQESEASFRGLFEHNPHPMWTFDHETLAFLSVNDAALAQYGFSREEFLAMTIRDIVPPEDVSTLPEYLNKKDVSLGEKMSVRHRRKDGSSIVVEITAYTFLSHKRPARLVIADDVTARTSAAEKLRLSEENLSITLQSIGDAMIATDAAGIIVRMNAAAERLTAWTQADAIGRPLREVFHIVAAGTRLPSVDPVQQVMESGAIVGLANHTVLIGRDGREYQISDSAAPIRTAIGEIVGVVLVFSDVTEAYDTRQALGRTADLLERVGQLAKVGGWALNLSDMKLYWSLETCRIFECDSLVAPPYARTMELFVPEARPVIEAAMNAAITLGTPWDLELQKFTLKGRMIWIRTQGIAVVENGKVIELLGASQDITERKRAEAAVLANEAFTSAILDSVTSEIAVLEQDGTIVAVNEAWRRFARQSGPSPGRPALEIPVGTNYLSAQNVGDNRINATTIEALDGIRGVLNGSLSSFTLEYPCHSPQQQRWCTLSATPLGLGDGRAVVAYSDITQRVQAEAARAAIIDSSLDAIITVDESECVLVFNAAAEKLFRLPAAEAIGQMLDRFIPNRYRNRHEGNIRDLMASDELARKNGKFMRLNGLRHDATDVPLDISITHVVTDGKHFFTVTLRDVSDREAADAQRESLAEQLRESQKMEAIGTLAGGIAHDFNNILAAILGNADLAHQELGNDARVAESLAEIRKAGGRARNLVQQILSFSRRQATEQIPMALAPIIFESARLLRATLPARIIIEVLCEPDVPLVKADATQVEQILINLINNAAQAMQQRPGHIRVTLDTVTLDATLSDEHPALLDMRKLHAIPTGPIVRLIVSDDGCGIDEVTLKRVFEPFFTTKPPGEGTGLGLSVVHGIVQAHGGTIVIKSELDKGTVFTLYLPPSSTQSGFSAPAESPALPAPRAGDGQHILYIDDDESLVFLVTRLMERRGCRISGFSDQREALEALRVNPIEFDLVVTDYNMPGMSGLDVAREVRTIRADLPVAIASGFIDETLRAEADNAGVLELIFKANAAEELCEAFLRLAQAVTRR